MKSALNDLDGSEIELTDSTKTSFSCNEKTGDNDEEKTNSVVEASVYCKIETRPPVQFGLNGKNLDLMYSGHESMVIRPGTAKVDFLGKWFGVRNDPAHTKHRD